jgi:hypothetical protein
MIRKVAAHVYDAAKECWRVHLRCGHVVITAHDDHARAVKGRFCPNCPGAEKALMADLRNEEAEELRFGEVPPEDNVRRYRWDLLRGMP